MAELPRVKVCGLTRAEDVRAAVEAGADALGFVRHAPSPRHVPPARTAALAAAVPEGLAAFAVLVDATPADTVAHLAATGLGWVQLCGDERPEDWRGFDAPLLRRVAVDDGAEQEVVRWEGIAAGFVLDHPGGRGGTGRLVDLELAARLAARVPCLLAGGLGPDNVAERIAAVRPRGVDASSRLEAAPGLKDPIAVQDFVRAARAALEECAR